MGYSARYHAASLAAVFLALAIGILIGSQFGGDVLNSTRQDLEKSLTKDLDAARSQVDDLDREIGWSEDFGNTVYPLLVNSRLAGHRVGLVGFGELPSDVTDAVERSIQPSGAELVAVGAVRQPPSLTDLADALEGTRFMGIDEDQEQVSAYGRTIGRQLVNGGRILSQTRSELMSQSSGQFNGLDGLIIYRRGGAELDAADAELAEQLDRAIVEGATSTRSRVIGVETLDEDPSTIGFFRDRNLTTVDNVDSPAGKISLIYSLAGAEGSFGVKDGSSRMLPELLQPVDAAAPRGSTTGRSDGKQG
ncbi:MAG: copper transporter [Actinomycetota bacterium]|nr:copper transporter [Actinomycetota bacterium]